eukprot:212230_1
MLSDDAISHILSFLQWRDLIFCSMNINIQFKRESIKSLERIEDIVIYCNSDDCFCIEYLTAHNIMLNRLSTALISSNSHQNVVEQTQIINRFIIKYKSQLLSLNLQQTVRMFSGNACKQTVQHNFNSLISLIINDYIMH